MVTKKTYSRRELLTRFALFPAALAATRVDLFGASSPTTQKGWVSLFDGKTISGWHTNKERIPAEGSAGLWEVKKGVLICQHDPPGSGNGGLLMTDKKYGDFEFEVDVNPDFGIDSGVYLRTTPQGECFQIYLDYRDNGLVGFISTVQPNRIFIRPFCFDGIFDDKGKLTGFTTRPDSRDIAWKPDYLLYHCSPEEWKKTWKMGKWNTMRIRCVGKYPRITTWINNVKIMEFCGETCPHPGYRKEETAQLLGREGHIALQIHGGTGGWKAGNVVRWKNMRVKEL